MDALVLFSCLIIGYVLLRSRGGEGLNIRFDLGAITTNRGKTNRVVLGTSLAVWSFGLIFVLIHQRGDERLSLLMSCMGGALVFLIFYLKGKFRK